MRKVVLFLCSFLWTVSMLAAPSDYGRPSDYKNDGGSSLGGFLLLIIAIIVIVLIDNALKRNSK